jgi:hypothetical protein
MLTAFVVLIMLLVLAEIGRDYARCGGIVSLPVAPPQPATPERRGPQPPCNNINWLPAWGLLSRCTWQGALIESVTAIIVPRRLIN